MPVVVCSAGAPHILKQLKDGMLCRARHAHNRIDAASIYQGSNDLYTLCGVQAIHDILNVLQSAVHINIILDFVLRNAVQYVHEAEK